MSEQVPAGYVWHCYTKSREGDGPLFVAHDDTVTARLDGYAVIPREEYDALIAERDAALERAECLLASQAPDLNRTLPAIAHFKALEHIARLEAALRAPVERARDVVAMGLCPIDVNALVRDLAALADAPGETPTPPDR